MHELATNAFRAAVAGGADEGIDDFALVGELLGGCLGAAGDGGDVLEAEPKSIVQDEREPLAVVRRSHPLDVRFTNTRPASDVTRRHEPPDRHVRPDGKSCPRTRMGGIR
jgi:hypothetical protein